MNLIDVLEQAVGSEYLTDQVLHQDLLLKTNTTNREADANAIVSLNYNGQSNCPDF